MMRLAWRYLWAQPLTTGLNLLLLSLGLGALGFVLTVSEQIEAGMSRDLAAIDLVVGAKGSPMQIMLSGVFHADVPTGNIPWSTLDLLRRQPLVQQAVPLALGDSYQGHRIVGTEGQALLSLYGAHLAQGELWSQPLQVVVGAEVARASGLRLGQGFAGSHGLSEAGGPHAGQEFHVVGVLAATGTALDHLILTDTASVWALHEGRGSSAADATAGRETTVVLLRYRSPLAAISLPRWVNAQPGLQAASPALETARLMRMVGVGAEVLRGFGGVLLLSAGLSVWVALLHAVRAREGELAMLRMLGAPPRRVAGLVLSEALLLALCGSVLGLALAHGALLGLERLLDNGQSVHWVRHAMTLNDLWVALFALGIAALAAAWPAWRAYRVDVTTLLQAPH